MQKQIEPSVIRLQVERTFDVELIQRITKHPSIWEHVSEDGQVSFEPAEVILNPDYYFLVTKLNDEVLGYFLGEPQGKITWECHTCLLPEIRLYAVQVGKLAMQWMFENTACRKIITRVPIYNKAAYLFAKRSGFEDEGINRKSYLKNGIAMDQYMLGITREAVCQ